MDKTSAEMANGRRLKCARLRTVKESRTERRSSQANPTRAASATATAANVRARRHPVTRSSKDRSPSVARAAEVFLTVGPFGLLSVVYRAV